MKNKKQKHRVKKFIKQDKYCNICEQKHDKLSADHVPLKSCPPKKERFISQLRYKLLGDSSFQLRISQSGVKYETICNQCNNNLGSKYDWALVDLSKKIESLTNSNIILPDSFEIECYPNAIIRSVLGHLLAAKTITDKSIIDSLIRPCILDESIPIDKNIHVFYWIYPYDKIIILRDVGMPSIRNKLTSEICIFSIIKFFPIAFLVTYQLDKYENLQNLYQFNNLSIKDKANLQINLKNIKKATWPEECIGFENFLLIGQSFDDSVYSVPRK
ncbi:hypothetical protein [Cyanobacterium aponinum]|uniref:hypothetical protein n=1 Tax=Cyanobacterium aponinum TaxID=379064 RepID=UPI000C12B0B8|nr:hypothetical protein [Cyanobacterium aponinum]PHV61913.1 hypothetical protein CSQ80_13280 [Cyanobacterium aponinum IPPAS B-1201]